MASREIPRSEWSRFFESFTDQHEGWFATLELLGREAAPDAEETPLRLISIAPARDDPEAVTITLGDAVSRVEHTIYDAERVVFEEGSEGRHRGLDVESADGERTLVHFRSPMAPEALDRLRTDEE